MDEGLRLLEDGVTLTEGLGVRACLALWTTHLGEGLLAAGQVERARVVAQRALELAQLHKERGHEGWALRLIGDIAAQGGEAEREAAFAAYAEALALAEELKMRPLVARVHLSLAQLHARAGSRTETEEHLGVAMQLLREMDIRFWAARAAEELMGLGHLFIVARHNVELYEYLKQEFAGEPVTVMLDRRESDRRQQSAGSDGDERRQDDRRRNAEIQESLHTRGFVIVRES